MKASVRDLTEAERAQLDIDQVARENSRALEQMMAGADARAITVAELRAAVMAWEVDVRADRDAFVQDCEARALPLDEQVDGIVATILRYVAGAQADGSPLGG